jgi:hypothetical protein
MKRWIEILNGIREVFKTKKQPKRKTHKESGENNKKKLKRMHQERCVWISNYKTKTH